MLPELVWQNPDPPARMASKVRRGSRWPGWCGVTRCRIQSSGKSLGWSVAGPPDSRGWNLLDSLPVASLEV